MDHRSWHTQENIAACMQKRCEESDEESQASENEESTNGDSYFSRATWCGFSSLSSIWIPANYRLDKKESDALELVDDGRVIAICGDVTVRQGASKRQFFQYNYIFCPPRRPST